MQKDKDELTAVFSSEPMQTRRQERALLKYWKTNTANQNLSRNEGAIKTYSNK